MQDQEPEFYEVEGQMPTSPVIDEEELITRKYGYSKADLLQRLGESVKAVLRTQLFFERNGVEVDAPEIRIRAGMKEIKKFTEEEADILLLRTPFSIEVKGRPGLRFKEATDFSYPDVSVDTVSGYRSKARKPLAYVVVSGDYEGGIVLPTFTQGDWRIERKNDRRRDTEDDFYFADKKHFKGRRRWLVNLCLKLQACGDGDYDRILRDYEFPADAVRRFYPR